MLDFGIWQNNWRFFCTLCDRFASTIKYVDDKLDSNGKYLNGNTFSNEYAALILLTSSEFESVAKQLCIHFDSTYNLNTSNVISISETILKHRPNIKNAIVDLPNKSYAPLCNWSIIHQKGKSDILNGLDWWIDHNQVKHDRYNHFEKASMNNCIDALSSLLVLELYMAQEVENINAQTQSSLPKYTMSPVYYLSTNHCSYFSFRYLRGTVLLPQDPLP